MRLAGEDVPAVRVVPLGEILLQDAPGQQVEMLVVAADLHVTVQGEGVVALHQGVEAFMQAHPGSAVQAVAEVLAGNGCGTRLVRLGLDDTYSSVVGTQEYLREEYSLDAKSIVSRINTSIADQL